MIIVSGLSGSGKSTVLRALEDLQYYCVDNLPLALLKPFADSLMAGRQGPPTVAVVGIDVRTFSDDLDQFPKVITRLRREGINVEVLFLQAVDEALIKRYSETRRRHPLDQGNNTLIEAIHSERDLLNVVLAEANLVIDTTHTTVYELRQRIKRLQNKGESLSLLIESFGFKHGVPVDADFVFDVRNLPNPHWDLSLRPFTGKDAPVQQFLQSHREVQALIEAIGAFFTQWLPHFESSDRSYLTIAVGCTGGQHRSVYVVEQLAQLFRQRRGLQVRHRELERSAQRH